MSWCKDFNLLKLFYSKISLSNNIIYYLVLQYFLLHKKIWALNYKSKVANVLN